MQGKGRIGYESVGKESGVEGFRDERMCSRREEG